MRSFIARLLALCLAIGPAFADSAYVAPTATGQAATGQIPGTTTNDNATAGNLGEVIASIGQASAGTVTFTNGTATVSDTAACTSTQTFACVGIGQVVNFTTTGALPTNFVVGTNYYVIATSFTAGVSYQVSATPFGTAITAGSAGSGTQTRNNTAILGNGTFTTIGAVSLTAGDWACSGSSDIETTGITTVVRSFIGTTHNSSTGQIFQSESYDAIAITGAAILRSGNISRILLSGTTVYYWVGSASFSTGVSTGAGSLTCRRAR